MLLSLFITRWFLKILVTTAILSIFYFLKMPRIQSVLLHSWKTHRAAVSTPPAYHPQSMLPRMCALGLREGFPTPTRTFSLTPPPLHTGLATLLMIMDNALPHCLVTTERRQLSLFLVILTSGLYQLCFSRPLNVSIQICLCQTEWCDSSCQTSPCCELWCWPHQ